MEANMTKYAIDIVNEMDDLLTKDLEQEGVSDQVDCQFYGRGVLSAYNNALLRQVQVHPAFTSVEQVAAIAILDNNASVLSKMMDWHDKECTIIEKELSGLELPNETVCQRSDRWQMCVATTALQMHLVEVNLAMVESQLVAIQARSFPEGSISHMVMRWVQAESHWRLQCGRKNFGLARNTWPGQLMHRAALNANLNTTERVPSNHNGITKEGTEDIECTICQEKITSALIQDPKLAIVGALKPKQQASAHANNQRDSVSSNKQPGKTGVEVKLRLIFDKELPAQTTGRFQNVELPLCIERLREADLGEPESDATEDAVTTPCCGKPFHTDCLVRACMSDESEINERCAHCRSALGAKFLVRVLDLVYKRMTGY